MRDFEYRVSVIVPIYNVEKYLEDCLDSLVNQTIDNMEMEVILINDGSVDQSLDICNEYAEIYPFFKVLCTNNQGVSAARNQGICVARGKYIAFLDGDDTLTKETIESVVDFFDLVYDEVDLVTYKIVPFFSGKKQRMHFRYKYLNKTGIYDLNEMPYSVQTTMNIVVKNNKNILFDTNFEYHEDQKFICSILADKMRLGYSDKGEYIYNKHTGSATSDKNYSYYMFEKRLELRETLILPYEKDVPKYIQSYIITDFMWELSADKLFPYHYKEEEYRNAIQRIQDILSHIDVDIIYNHPEMDNFHKHFWLAMKKNTWPTVVIEESETSIWIRDICIYKRKGIEIIINKLNIRQNILEVMGFVKSPIFNYIESEPTIYAIINKSERDLIEHYESINSCYKSKAKTNKFWGFRFEKKVVEVETLSFLVEIDGIIEETFFYYMPSVVANTKVNTFVRKNYEIVTMKNEISISKCDENRKRQIEELNGKKCSFEANKIRNLAISKRKNEKIWLYSDSAGIGVDNAYYQFKHDWNKADGVKRYYVCDGNRSEIKNFFMEEQQKFLIEYGSDRHKILYLCAEYILCSFIDIHPRSPFSTDLELVDYQDLEQPQVIYLQHGVCHADLRYTQSAERCKVDKIVISSYFEYKNFCENYHYKPEDLIPCGMARYDNINRYAKAKNRILFAPSWREYLTYYTDANIRLDNRELLLKSDYYRKFIDFLGSVELDDFLEKNDMYLDAKLHQNMQSAVEIFNIKSKRIKFVDKNVNVADYKIFITDISSYVFDFAYLNRPIIYFMPDMNEFLSGMHSYRRLELPFEQAFGNLVIEYQDAINEIKRIADNDFRGDRIYSERMEKFFFPLDNCKEGLYEYLRSYSL